MGNSSERAVAFAREASLGMPGSLRDVADYLLAEGTGIGSQTMAQVAAHTYVSKPTLVRFAKQAGYSGWTAYRHDFLVAMAEEERERAAKMDVDVNRPFDADSSPIEVATAVAHIHQLAANEVARALDPAVLSDAADAILASNRVAVLGAMQNLDRGRVFASNLALMGVWCEVPRMNEAVPLTRVMTPGDCAVFVSYSGDLSHQPQSLAPGLRERGVSVVAITNSRHGQLGPVAHHALTFAPLEHLHQKAGPFYSGACTSLLLDALYATCRARRFEQGSRKRDELLSGQDGLVPQEWD